MCCKCNASTMCYYSNEQYPVVQRLNFQDFVIGVSAAVFCIGIMLACLGSMFRKQSCFLKIHSVSVLHVRGSV